MNKTIELPFSQADADRAYTDWGCNCGPAALAAILDLSLDAVRPAVESAGFSDRRYMSPTMMKAALRYLRVCWSERQITPADIGGLAFPNRGLARIQWEGPWTAPGANPKWAYRQTHWVASWKSAAGDATVADKVWSQLSPVIFDINGGLMEFNRWEEEIVPLITSSIPRADGDWHVTHCWEIEP
jgi:hypothetical protein